ncbi:glutamate--tRNA ligase 1 [Tistrella bauzanensis]|uniref:Glutamate--tRNA ligase n=1 Tax=Tistrella bauzanensis TaxID=657419 RepID=A0ABQ1IPB3_9PROT|nr:glutamate--tRNA ligase [Tistrella bauzanensis]GGB49168.1 glutamate--tRNA ligase 1 [Tistrella bauzanensis]
MTVKTRFAPSPTGRLHVGNARTALVNWLYARQSGGLMQLRIDDTDRDRSLDVHVEGILADLDWLGLAADECFRQTDRADRHAAAFDGLVASGRLYPCYETPEELGIRRKAQLAAGRPPVYDRAALRLTDADRQTLEADGRRPHWRFRLDDRETAWDDMIRGRIEVHAGSLSDPVLIRADGAPTYTLATVVDDAETGVTHVIRGEDHITNTAAQIQLFHAFGADEPRFGHLAWLLDPAGAGLSKRIGSMAVGDLRDDGIEPMAVAAFLTRLGTSDAVEPAPDLAALVASFDITRFGRAAARFDPAELLLLNARQLRLADAAAAAPRLAAIGVPDAMAPAFWDAVSGNLERFGDAAIWWRVVAGPVDPVILDDDTSRAVLAAARDTLPDEPWDEASWGLWTKAVQIRAGVKGKALFRPLRLALTASEHGPELKKLLPMIGRARVLARLCGEAA